MIAWDTPSVDNDSEYNEADDGDDFYDRKYELSLAVASDAEEVNKNDGHQEYSHPSSPVNVPAARPEFECQRRGDNLKRKSHKPLKGIAGKTVSL